MLFLVHDTRALVLVVTEPPLKPQQMVLLVHNIWIPFLVVTEPKTLVLLTAEPQKVV